MENFYMGFNETNTSQKIRISLSKKAMLTIEDDMTAFEVPKLTTFINQVISNFWDISESSIDNYLNNKELELKEKLSASSIDSYSIEQVIQILLKDEKKRLINKTASYDNGSTVNKQYNINNNNYIFLTEECMEDKYYATAAKYLRCLIEEYCRLPFIKRERIYKRSSYTTVENACKNHNVLKVKALIDGTQKLLYVYPYMIMPDPLATQEYLVCYVKNENSATRKHIASFSMARLQLQGSALKQTFRLTKDDIIAIEKKLADSSPAYLLGTNERVVVKLTEVKNHIKQNYIPDRLKSQNPPVTLMCSTALPCKLIIIFFLSAKKQKLSNQQAFARNLKIAITTVLINTGRKIYQDIF